VGKSKGQATTKGMGIPCIVLRIPLRHHCTWEEQENGKEENTLCEEDKIQKEARGHK